jgi:hypothetical protein
MEVDESWLESWQRADVLAAAAVETALFSSDQALTGMHVARIAASAVPDGGLFYVGASSAVRHVGTFAANTVQDAVILGNRGTSGIDGTVSSAWGAAAALQRNGGSGAVALMGDHTFLYDSNGLLAPSEKLIDDERLRKIEGDYSNDVFWHELVARLADRDLAAEQARDHATGKDGPPIDADARLKQIEDAYWDEFEKHDLAHFLLLRGAKG